MKKIFFIALLLFFYSAFGQTPYPVLRSYDFLSSPINKTLIREHLYPKSVIYIETLQKHYFALVDPVNEMLINYVEIDGNYFINDFCVRKDSVFFCGNDKKKGKAIIGFYNIADFFYGNMNLNVFDDFHIQYANSQINTFKHIESYISSNGEIHIVCDGIAYSNILCLVDLFYESSINVWKYTSGDLHNYPKESIRDVTLTEDYIVTAGFWSDSNAKVALRCYDKNNIFANNGIQDHIFVFDGDSSEYTLYPSENIVLSNYNGDTVVAAAEYKHPSWTGNANGVELFGFKLNYNGIINPQMIINRIEYYPCFSYSYQLKGIVSDHNNKRFFLLRDLPDNLCSQKSVVSEIRFHIFPGYDYNYYYDSAIFYGFDLYNNTQFVVTGRYNYDAQKLYIGTNTFSSGANCMNLDIVHYWDWRLYGMNKRHCPFSLYSSAIELNIIHAAVNFRNRINTECYTY